MNFFANVNWETVLTVAVPGLILFLGTVYNDIRKKKNAQIDTKTATALKREPTWVELEESNRKLRQEMDERDKANDEKLAEQKLSMDAQVAQLRADLGEFKQKTNVKIAAMSNMLHTASVQWPADHPGPLFEPEDLSALEHTDVPFVWRNRVRNSRS